MTVQYLTINDGDLMPLDTIKRIRIVTDEDRQSLAKLGDHVKPERFETYIEPTRGKRTYATQTIDEIARQGVTLVQIDERAFIPATNIVKARNLSETDRKKFKERTGRTLKETFQAQVETKAGTVLSTATAEEVIGRISSPYEPSPAS